MDSWARDIAHNTGMNVHISRHQGRSVLPFVFFLGFFAILLAAVSRWYLLPALDAFNHADVMHRKLLAVHALLVMFLLLMTLGVMLMLMFRVGRFFFPGPGRVKTTTKYVDAWAEAGKRLEPEPSDDAPPDDEAPDSSPPDS